MEKDLTETPYRFDFVQAVRLIYLMLDREKAMRKRYVGYDNAPDREAIRFTSSVELRHCASDVRAIQRENGRFLMEVSFLGLVGASGVLPHHYTRLLSLRLKEHDSSMRDFLELFQHRLTSHFFRASTKYRLPIQYELFSRPKDELDDPISRCIARIVGFGHSSLFHRTGFNDSIFLFYGGHFAQGRPTKTALTRMLEEITGLNVELYEFQLEWLQLEESDQTRLGPSCSQLGVNAVAGSQVPSVQNRFRIRLKIPSWSGFLSLLPDQPRLKDLSDFTRTYVGIGLDFDFQLVIAGPQVPCAQLGSPGASQLGWTTWCTSQSMLGEVDDAVFEVD